MEVEYKSNEHEHLHQMYLSGWLTKSEMSEACYQLDKELGKEGFGSDFDEQVG